MNKKWFIYPLITVAIATVNFLSAMETIDSREMQIIAEERVARLLDISSEQLHVLLSDSQDQDVVSIVHKRDSKGWTPLMHIAKDKFLCEKCTKNLKLTCQHEEYKKLLHEVYEKVARLLIEDDADINVKNNNNMSALLIAFNSKNKLIIELLLSQPSVDLDTQDKRGLTPLHHAIELGDDYDTIADQLIKKGVSLDIKTKKRKETPLMFAARRNCLSLVNTLLTAGANPLVQDSVGQTAAGLTTDSAVKHAIVKAKIKKRGESVIEKKSSEALQAAIKSAREREKKERERRKLKNAEEKELREKALQAAIKSVKKREEEDNARIEQELQVAENAERCQREEEQTKLEQERQWQAEQQERLAIEKVQKEKEVAEQQKREEKERCQREEQTKLEQERPRQAEQERLAGEEAVRRKKEKEQAEQQKREEKEHRQRKEEQTKLEQERQRQAEQERLAIEGQKREKTIENKTTVMQSLARKIKSYIGKVFSRIKRIKETVLSSLNRLRNWLW